MNFTFTDEQNQFRKEIREFFEAELAAGNFTIRCGGLFEEPSLEMSRKMSKKGLIGLTWPQKYGGHGRGYVDKAILMEEVGRLQVPIGHHFLADRQVGPALIHAGSEWQKDFFLPRIINAEEDSSFCLLFSEPNAGSDLVSVATTAVKDGDYYVINGQKVWTSKGHKSAYGWLLARTTFDEKIPRHLSCSEFIVDMKSPGVDIRPIINMADEHCFNEVFFSDVRIHKKFLVGKENAGFKQIMAQVDYERAGFERLTQNYPVYDQLKRYVEKLDKSAVADYGWIRDSIAQMETEYSIGRLLCYYTAWIIDQGRQPTSEAALCKAYCTQFEQRVNDLATTILGPTSLIRGWKEWEVFGGDMATCYLWSPSYTLQGGSVEILKNIIANRKLGFSRS